MRIEEVEILGFGKWKEARFRFAPGINLLVAGNEAGKTTLMEAIIALLYGMKRDYVRRNSKREEWERYRPWDSSLYGGRITYQLKGRLYRLHRNFDTDEHRLYDGETLRELTGEFPMDARKERPFLQEQTGLTRTLFEELTRIGPIGFQDGKTMMEWLHRLTGETKGETPAYHEVFALLERKKREIGTGQGKGTLLGQAMMRLEEAQENLEKAKRDLEHLRSLERRVYQLQSERLALERRIREWERRWRAWEEEQKEWSDPEPLYRERERLLADQERWESVLKEWEQIAGEEKEAEKRLQALDRVKMIDAVELEGLDESLRSLRMKREILTVQLRQEQEKAAKRTAVWLGLAAALLAAAGAGAALLSHVWTGLFLLLGGAVLGSLSFRAFHSARKGFTRREMGWMEREQEQERRLLQSYGLESYEEYLRFREEQREIHREEEEIRRRLPELHARKRQLLSAVAEMLDREGAVPVQKGADLADLPAVAAERLGHCEDRLAALQRQIEETGLKRRRLQVLAEELQEEQRVLQEEKVALEREMARLRGEMSVYGHPNVEERENQYALAVEELERLQRKRRILDLAQQLFEETLDEWNRMVSPEINHKASEIYRQLTGGKYDQVRADPMDGFRLRAIERESRQIRDHSQLSQGAEQQLYFAFRLALLHRFSSRIPLPLFLDDSFAHYDPVRLQQALACLCDMFARHQIFLFSCQGREQEILEKMGARFTCISLEQVRA